MISNVALVFLFACDCFQLFVVVFQLFDLEERRKESMQDLAVIIQKTFRGWVQRTKVGCTIYVNHILLWSAWKRQYFKFCVEN